MGVTDGGVRNTSTEVNKESRIGRSSHLRGRRATTSAKTSAVYRSSMISLPQLLQSFYILSAATVRYETSSVSAAAGTKDVERPCSLPLSRD